MASISVPTPIVNPVFSPGTPANIIQAYINNRDCICAPDDSLCSNCLTVGPEYLLESRDRVALNAIIAFPIIAFVIVFLRTYSRAVILRKIGLDDVLAVSTFVLSIILIQMGSGRHLAYIQFVIAQDNDALNATETLDFIAHILYTTALLLCRLSGIAFYLRLLDRSTSWQVTLCKAGAVLLCLGFVPQIVLLIIHCLPVTSLWPYGWQSEASEYTCLAWGTVYSTNSGISLMCDILLLGIAATLIASWNLSIRSKLSLLPVLLPGVGVLGISIGRLYLVIQGQWQADQAWWYNPQMVIENVEISLTLIALCAPGLKPLITKVRQSQSAYYMRNHRMSVKSEDSRTDLGRSDRKDAHPTGYKMQAMIGEIESETSRRSNGSRHTKETSTFWNTPVEPHSM